MFSRLHLGRLQVTTAVLVLLLLVAGSAFAADPSTLFPPLNEVMSKGLGHKLPRVKIDQDLPPAMVFAVPVPAKDWQRLPPDNATINPIQLAAFAAPQGPASGLVEVLATELHQEVGAADWLLALMQTNGFKQIDGRRELTASGIAFEALGSKQDPKQGEILVRAGVWRSGTMLFTVWCSAKRDSFTKLARDYAVCLAGFKLADPQPVKLVGDWAKHCIAKVLCYTGPAEKPQERKASGLPIREQYYLFKRNGHETGIMRLSYIEPQRLPGLDAVQRVTLLRKYLNQQGVRLSLEKAAKPSTNRLASRGDVIYLRGKIAGQKPTRDVLAMFMVLPKVASAIWLETVTPGQNIEAFLLNKRVLDIIAASVYPAKRDRGN